MLFGTSLDDTSLAQKLAVAVLVVTATRVVWEFTLRPMVLALSTFVGILPLVIPVFTFGMYMGLHESDQWASLSGTLNATVAVLTETYGKIK